MNFLNGLVAFSVRRWQFTVLMFLMFAALGYSSWLAIPRAEDPAFPVPIYTTVAVYPGASPEDMEQLVTEPIEKRLYALTDVKELKSVSSNGLSVVTVEFDSDVDAERKYDQVLREINGVRPELPEALLRLNVQRNENSDLAVLQLALVAPVTPYATLDDIAQRFEDGLSRVDGVKEVKRWAAPPREMQVTLDLGKLAARSLTPSQVLNALGSDNVQIPGGAVDVGTRRFNVATPGRYRTVDDVLKTVVGGGNGAVIRVSDLATVAWADGDAVHVGRYNGQRAMFVTVAVQEGRNVTTVRNAVWEQLDLLEKTLPAGVTLARGFDQSRNVEARLSQLGKDFALAIALVLVTLLPLGFRASIIVMISIPLSLALAIVLLNASGFSLNQLSIVGFVIALGLVGGRLHCRRGEYQSLLAQRHVAHAGRHRRHQTNRCRCVGCDRDAHLCVSSPVVPARIVGQVHTLAAHRGGVRRACQPVGVAHHHSVARQSCDATARTCRRKSVLAVAR